MELPQRQDVGYGRRLLTALIVLNSVCVVAYATWSTRMQHGDAVAIRVAVSVLSVAAVAFGILLIARRISRRSTRRSRRGAWD